MRSVTVCATRRHALLPLAATAAVAVGLVACNPALNWRDTRPPNSAVVALFPCKPDHHVRRVTLAGAALAMQLSSCTAAGSVYALSHIDVGQAERVTPVMRALREAAAGNIGGTATAKAAQPVPGTAPHPLAQRLGWRGVRADGSSIAAQALFFTQGVRVYQATVVGTRLDTDAVDVFFAALKLP